MNVLLFGATGMVGQSVLRECLLDPRIKRVVTIGRNATGQQHPKLSELVHANLLDLSALEGELSGFDACFFCLGVSSAAMSEEKYTAITYDLTMSVAKTLVRLNPAMTFTYVTGAGTDSSERGRSMWARIKGKTENDLLKLPFKAAYMFRPGGILPLHGVRSKTKLYQAVYTIMKPFYPLLEKWFPNSVTTSEKVGRAMIEAAINGYPKPIIESSDLNRF
ncbi:NAD-dependent epimerase/dehydratase family protein [Paenibacillus sp. CGMCC 1.16610]|uniref:NAD-dependent epimerase/dehydratase family protein n=1 Tax=Paenibacillus anseongense TaxID=2682845 RepID=A0ABW9UD31_9BACL|nr:MULTISPECIES: NAD-dependent epimerase/dehydratase family protein [Paenibacillus]MBA2943944.1 NAD-dependent epimerase/dehydratase family protein [Paenibacillus sp. CGMCC 1.16610]MVQ37833.1 NAD-dependent epimerase/dehydratase family protein [Paenibacillus anseongense]